MLFVQKLTTRNSKPEVRNSKRVRPSGSLLAFRFSIFDFPNRICSRILATAASLVALGYSTAAWAQTCPMCYRAAAAAKAGAVHALRSGVLILMVPPVLIVGGITLLAIRGRDRFNDESETEPMPESVDDREFSAWLESLPHTGADGVESRRSEGRSSAA